MDLPRNRCPVCDTPAAVDGTADGIVGVSCPRCGDFRIAIGAFALLDELVVLDRDRRLLLSGPVREVAAVPGYVIGKTAVRNLLARSRSAVPAEDPFALLHYVRRTRAAMRIEGWAAVMLTPSTERAFAALEYLIEQGWITLDRSSTEEIRPMLTDQGRLRIDPDGPDPRRLHAPERHAGRTYGQLQLRELRIDRVRCFAADQTIMLDEGEDGSRWTILIGENGVGKTSVLRLIAALWPTDVRGVETGPLLAAWPLMKTAVEPNKRSDGRCRAEALFAVRSERGREHLLNGSGLGLSFDRLIGDMELGFDRISLSHGNNGLTYTGNFDLVGRPLLFGYGATRVVGSSSLARKETSEGGLGSLFDQEQVLRNPEEWLLQADYSRRLSPDGRADERYGQIHDALLALLPGVTGMSIKSAATDSEAPIVLFETAFGAVRYDELGLGYRSTIGWTVDLAARLFDAYPDRPDPLSGEAYVLIDEIDLHLHPSWQRGLLSDLCRIFPAVKFIATTHSPLVIQGAEGARVFLLRQVDGAVHVVEEDAEVSRWRVDQILTSDLFGIDSPRSQQVEELENRRAELLSRATLTDADWSEVRQLESEIGDRPVGETSEDRRAMALIRRVAGSLAPK